MRGVGTVPRGCARERGAAFVRRLKREKKTHPTLSDTVVSSFFAPTQMTRSISGRSHARSPLRANSLAEIIWMTCERDFPCGGVLETREARVPGAVSHARTQVVARAGPSRVRCLSPPRCVSPRRLRSARIARRSRVHHHPSFGAIRLTERSTALFILLRHAQAAAARVAPRNGLSSRRRVATGTVALRAQPRSRTVARSAPYTPLKINAVRHRLVKPIPCEACAFRHARAPRRVGTQF